MLLRAISKIVITENFWSAVVVGLFCQLNSMLMLLFLLCILGLNVALFVASLSRDKLVLNVISSRVLAHY